MRKKFGIIGWPVEHSVSPQMQEAGFKELGIDASYERVPARPEELGTVVERLRTMGFSGWNVTVPHKRAIISLLDDVDTTAELTGSVNTVINTSGKLFGTSTDGYGLEASINESFDVDIANRVFLFWGIGGAAVACCYHFLFGGAAELILVNRTASKATELKEALNRISANTKVTTYEMNDLKSLKSAFRRSNIVIQCTSVGLNESDPVSIPLELIVPPIKLVDMIYKQTRLLFESNKLGCDVIDGRGMLLHQGIKSFTLWTGKVAPIAAMRASLERALSGA